VGIGRAPLGYDWAASVISVTSSRNKTPPAANSIWPGFDWCAPVNEPRHDLLAHARLALKAGRHVGRCDSRRARDHFMPHMRVAEGRLDPTGIVNRGDRVSPKRVMSELTDAAGYMLSVHGKPQSSATYSSG
jgi:hypothetical protein